MSVYCQIVLSENILPQVSRALAADGDTTAYDLLPGEVLLTNLYKISRFVFWFISRWVGLDGNLCTWFDGDV